MRRTMRAKTILAMAMLALLSGCGSSGGGGEDQRGAGDGRASDGGLGAGDLAVIDLVPGDDGIIPLQDLTGEDTPSLQDTRLDTTPPEDLTSEDAVELKGVLSAYLPCEIDADCPVGYGDCITSIPLNRSDEGGVSSVPISQLDPDLTGICTLACSTSSSPCTSLTIKDSHGSNVPYTCQIVVAGSLPYPEELPEFPFDNQLVPGVLAAGQAFGAICRPPFELSIYFEDSFCKACTQTQECGSGLCWSFAQERENNESGQGTCLERCSEDEACPFGFECLERTSPGAVGNTVLGDFCVPLQNTCGICRDLDQDGRGLGRCGPSAGPVTPFDCDDHDERAYYDPSKPDHAFPEFCGLHDLNCNGLSDAQEQIGAEAFPAEHCTGCYEPCSGEVPNGVLTCITGEEGPGCVASCTDPEAFADCDTVAETGCETPVDDPTRLFYLDGDQDGFGAGDPVFACDAEGIPEGYVDDHSDCDDTLQEVNPGAAELCNDRDDDCNGMNDDEVSDDGGTCNTQLPGICAQGVMTCQGGQLLCVQQEFPVTEACNGLDDNCDGEIDNGIPGVGQPCEVPGLKGVCAAGLMGCDSQGQVSCLQVIQPSPDIPDLGGIDSNCDGIDGDKAAAVFVDPTKSDDNNGTMQNPKRTIAAAMTLAQATGRTQIYLAGDIYPTDSPLVLVNGISLYGGFKANTWERFSDTRTTIQRTGLPNSDGLVIGVKGLNLTSETRLESIDILVEDATTGDSSVYGLICKTCPGLRLTDTTIQTGKAGDGSHGVSGGAGAAGEKSEQPQAPHLPGIGMITSCEYPEDSISGSGGNGGISHQSGYSGLPVGLGGAGGAAGTGTPQNPVSGKDGKDGNPAPEAALGGTKAGDGHVIATENTPVWWFPSTISAQHGAPGGGGGGGGGSPEYLPYAGAGGSSGGCGGQKGTAGKPGGISTALLLWQSNGIVLDGVLLISGDGGSGGNGGTGGVGGSGAEGKPAFAPFTGSGGAGGNGGGGGGGAGGNGGHSYSVIRDSLTSLSVGDGGLVRLFGTPGTAGTGGLGGLGGVSADTDPGTAGNPGEDGTPGKALDQLVL